MAILSTLCYIEQGENWLMLHRTKKKNDINSGKWIGVGGKFEEGESPEECLLREIAEETGIVPTSYTFRGIVTFVSDCAPNEYMHLFTATCPQNVRLRECDEGELAWVPRSEVLQRPLWPGDRIFLQLLQQREIPFFSLKLCYCGEKVVRAVLNGEETAVE